VGARYRAVELHVAGKAIQASVLDHGPPLPAQSPQTEADTDTLAVRGLWLLHRLVDEVRLGRVRRGTRVTLRRVIGPAKQVL
jgi:anti-sigma regulatory factor (Ser/Thr protein kinase)